MKSKMVNVCAGGKVIATVKESQLEMKEFICNKGFSFSDGNTYLNCETNNFDISIVTDKKPVMGVVQMLKEKRFLCYVTEATKEGDNDWDLTLLIADEM